MMAGNGLRNLPTIDGWGDCQDGCWIARACRSWIKGGGDEDDEDTPSLSNTSASSSSNDSDQHDSRDVNNGGEQQGQQQDKSNSDCEDDKSDSDNEDVEEARKPKPVDDESLTTAVNGDKKENQETFRIDEELEI